MGAREGWWEVHCRFKARFILLSLGVPGVVFVVQQSPLPQCCNGRSAFSWTWVIGRGIPPTGVGCFYCCVIPGSFSRPNPHHHLEIVARQFVLGCPRSRDLRIRRSTSAPRLTWRGVPPTCRTILVVALSTFPKSRWL
jgi:hypothetical protein